MLERKSNKKEKGTIGNIGTRWVAQRAKVTKDEVDVENTGLFFLQNYMSLNKWWAAWNFKQTYACFMFVSPFLYLRIFL